VLAAQVQAQTVTVKTAQTVVSAATLLVTEGVAEMMMTMKYRLGQELGGWAIVSA
jgi:hypothetical protein